MLCQLQSWKTYFDVDAKQIISPEFWSGFASASHMFGAMPVPDDEAMLGNLQLVDASVTEYNTVLELLEYMRCEDFVSVLGKYELKHRLIENVHGVDDRL